MPGRTLWTAFPDGSRRRSSRWPGSLPSARPERATSIWTAGGFCSRPRRCRRRAGRSPGLPSLRPTCDSSRACSGSARNSGASRTHSSRPSGHGARAAHRLLAAALRMTASRLRGGPPHRWRRAPPARGISPALADADLAVLVGDATPIRCAGRARDGLPMPPAPFAASSRSPSEGQRRDHARRPPAALYGSRGRPRSWRSRRRATMPRPGSADGRHDRGPGRRVRGALRRGASAASSRGPRRPGPARERCGPRPLRRSRLRDSLALESGQTDRNRVTTTEERREARGSRTSPLRYRAAVLDANGAGHPVPNRGRLLQKGGGDPPRVRRPRPGRRLRRLPRTGARGARSPARARA